MVRTVTTPNRFPRIPGDSLRFPLFPPQTARFPRNPGETRET